MLLAQERDHFFTSPEIVPLSEKLSGDNETALVYPSN